VKAAIFIMALLIVGVMSIFHFPRFRATAWPEKTAKPVLAEPAAPAKPPMLAGFGQWPLRFEANLGQTDSQVKFISRGSGYTMYLTSTEVVLAFSKRIVSNTSEVRGPRPVGHQLFASIFLPYGLQSATSHQRPATSRQHSIRFRFAGANFNPEITGMEELPGKSNYFIGNDPQQWRTEVPHYARVACREIYPGIDLVFYGNARRLEYDFVVSPGANPNDIRMVFTGADKLSLDEDGNLVIRLAEDEIRLLAPITWQERDSVRQPIASRFVLQDNDQVGFQISAYDTSRALVIDPILNYSTYAGGGKDERAQSIAVDRFGNVYVIGYTSSADFPIKNGFDTTYADKREGASDVFVIKLDKMCNRRYSTFIGGTDDDSGEDIAVDSSGNVYLTGYTLSTNFPPAGSSSFQRNKNGAADPRTGYDGFVAKLDSSGKILRYSTYLGGSANDIVEDIAVDGAGNIYVTGSTLSPDFPTEQADDDSLDVSATDTAKWRDAFVTALNANGSALLYSTYLGGNGADFGKDIAVDKSGQVYVTGSTESSDLKTTLNAPYKGPRPPSGDSSDVFVAKYKKAGNALTLNFLTYLYGSLRDYSSGIAVDGAENIYVTGQTFSITNFMPEQISTATRLGTRGVADIFVTKLKNVNSTYGVDYLALLGGSGIDGPGGIALDEANNVYLVGTSASKDFPVMRAIGDTVNGKRDVIVAKLDNTGRNLIYSTYLGGAADDFGFSIAVDVSQNVYMCGRTDSTSLQNFPIKGNAFQTKHGGKEQDAFMMKLQPATQMSASAGNNQSKPVTSPLSPFEVLITDEVGKPAPNVPVTFSISTVPNGSSLSKTNTQTDINGKASTILTLGNKAGIYQVTAAAAGLIGSPITFTATATANAPTLISPSNGAANQPTTITFSWNAETGATAYGLQVSTNSTFNTFIINDSSITSPSKPSGSLSNNTTYYWRVWAKNAGERSTYSQTRNFSTFLATPALSFPADSAINQPTTLTLSWNSVAGATVYPLQISTDFPFRNKVVFDSTITGTSQQVGPLAGNTTYYWRVQAKKGAGGAISYSATYSHVRSFTTQLLKSVSLPTPISFPPNPTQTDYRLFSVPGVSGLTVGDIIPSGEPKIDWRIYRDNGEASDFLKELSSQDKLSTGEGYWLLKKGTLNFARDLKMPKLNADATYSIPLHGGWNIIGNPFDRAVSWAAVVSANVPGLPGLKDYKQSDGYVSSNTLEPFKGYYFDNQTAGLDSLKLPYPFAGANANLPAVEAPAVDWKVQLIFNSDINRDAENYLGIAPQSRADWDALDSRKPPLFLDQGFLYFSRPAWDADYSRFSADFRPALGEGQVWEFEVSNPRLSEGKIQFKNIEKIPAEYEVLLINLHNTVPIDLRAQSEYTYQTAVVKTPFKLVVGKKAFVQQEASTLVPTQLELTQNFPNPFSPLERGTFGNPATSITFKLPQEAQIRLEVISVLGQRVRILAEGTFAPAVYTMLWDGTDQAGKPVAAGLYFYRLLHNEKIVQTRKMILTN